MYLLMVAFTCLLTLQAYAQEHVFVFLNKRTDVPPLPKGQLEKMMEGHRVNINRLSKEEKLVVAGSFDKGGGIFVLRTTSTEQAKAWLAADPAIKAEHWSMEYLPVTFRYRSACAAGENHEMVTYHLVRYGIMLSKFNVQEAPVTLRKHDAFVKQLQATGNVIAEATFGDTEGSLVVLSGEVDKHLFEASPAVQEQLYEVTVKKLWIAKGSFCEK